MCRIAACRVEAPVACWLLVGRSSLNSEYRDLVEYGMRRLPAPIQAVSGVPDDRSHPGGDEVPQFAWRSPFAGAPTGVDVGQPWRPFVPEPYWAHGHWVLNACNALDSGRTCEHGARQHVLRLVRHLPSRAGGRMPPLRPGRCCISLNSCWSWLRAGGRQVHWSAMTLTATQSASPQDTGVLGQCVRRCSA